MPYYISLSNSLFLSSFISISLPYFYPHLFPVCSRLFLTLPSTHFSSVLSSLGSISPLLPLPPFSLTLSRWFCKRNSSFLQLSLPLVLKTEPSLFPPSAFPHSLPTGSQDESLSFLPSLPPSLPLVRKMGSTPAALPSTASTADRPRRPTRRNNVFPLSSPMARYFILLC